jgi:DNA-directed RNA polymerase specialized sigma24 family protein
VDTQIMIELHYWEGMKIVDIAAVFDMPPSTIKTRMRRARHDLELRLETLAESPEQLAMTRSGLETWAARLRAEV